MSEEAQTTRASPLGRWLGVAMAILSAVLVVGGIVFFQFIYPALGIGPAQPIPFSHRLHVTVKEIDCRFCHSTVAQANAAGLPPVQKCLFCHTYVIPNHPKIKRLTSLAERGQPVAWRKVTWLPDFVHFSHQAHIRKGIECVACHGHVETMDRVKQVHPLNMGFCLKCHRERQASVDCLTCHY